MANLSRTRRQALLHGAAWLILCSSFASAQSPQRPSQRSTQQPARPQAAQSQATQTKRAPQKTPAESKYLLRYKFQPGEAIRWEVEHRAQVKTTVSGTTQEAETISDSVKLWKVQSVDKAGAVTFTHSVESIDMRQRMSGRQEVRYNSATDKEPPLGFQDAAKSVGVPLTTITIDNSGEVLSRQDHQTGGPTSDHPTMPLPREPVPIGHKWTVDFDTQANTTAGTPKKISMRQTLTLDEVRDGIATIRMATAILTPLGGDAALEAQLVQSELNGTIRFDLQAGRVISQESEADKHVVGFQGNASSMHYVTRFHEKLLPARPQTASRTPIAGPPLPPAN